MNVVSWKRGKHRPFAMQMLRRWSPIYNKARAIDGNAERDQINFDEGRRFERRAALAAQADDEAQRRAIIEDACDRAFGPDDDATK